MTVQLEHINYKSFVILKKIPIMLALCLILLVTYYAQNYAGITGWSLTKPNSLFALLMIREQSR